MPTTRREFLRRSALTTLGLGLAGPRAVRAALPSASTSAVVPRDPVVVAVNLDGGNDALNTVVPLGEYDRYRELRPRLGYEIDRLIPLPRHESDFGVNPALGGLVELFRDGKVALINGVGPPLGTLGLFNHEASQRVFVTAAIDGGTRAGPPTGWLGRAGDQLERGELPVAVGLGGGGTTLLVGAVQKPLVLPSIARFGVAPGGDAAARVAAYRRVQGVAGGLPSAAEHNRLLRLEVIEFSAKLQKLAEAHHSVSAVVYPTTRLGVALRDSAAVIAANRGVRLVGVRIAGFDTHGDQNQRAHPDDPFDFHERLLADVSESVSAFLADLEAVGAADNVVVLVFSEFGRRVQDNPTFGTDHGFGGTMFAIGKPVRGGVYGDYPSLDDLALGGNLGVHIDFRSVYATLLAEHLDLDPEPILGGAFPLAGFLG